jgi:hypothetical protein
MKYRISDTIKQSVNNFTDKEEISIINVENISFAKREAAVQIENWIKSNSNTVRRKEDWKRNKDGSFTRDYMIGLSSGSMELHRFVLEYIS